MASADAGAFGGVLGDLWSWILGEDLRTQDAVRTHPRTTPDQPPRPEPPAILMATVDSLAEPHQILGLLDAAMAAPTGIVPTARLMDLLANEAAAVGADAVIGIRLSQFTIPGAS